MGGEREREIFYFKYKSISVAFSACLFAVRLFWVSLRALFISTTPAFPTDGILSPFFQSESNSAHKRDIERTMSGFLRIAWISFLCDLALVRKNKPEEGKKNMYKMKWKRISSSSVFLIDAKDVLTIGKPIADIFKRTRLTNALILRLEGWAKSFASKQTIEARSGTFFLYQTPRRILYTWQFACFYVRTSKVEYSRSRLHYEVWTRACPKSSPYYFASN